MEPHSSSPATLVSFPEGEAVHISHQELSAPEREIVEQKESDSPTILQMIANLFRSATGSAGARENDGQSLKDALTALFKEYENEEGATRITADERRMLQNAIRFGEMTVADIMIPRMDIVAAPVTVTLDELKAMIVREQHTRIPVYRDSLDKIDGFLHLKDIAVKAFAGETFSIARSLRKILFVPPSMKLPELLLKMRRSSVHIAIVVDEYGGTDGLVTMENIVEEIVGEIHDEHDEPSDISGYRWLEKDRLESDARLELEVVRECFGEASVLDEDMELYDTVGGLVSAHLGYIPKAGESFHYKTGLLIYVMDADPRTVRRVRIERLQLSSATDTQAFSEK